MFPYTPMFPMFHDVLKNDIEPALSTYLLAGNDFSYFIHDHVTNSSDLFEEKMMDGVFGENEWLQHAPKICREFRGKISVV